MRLVFLALATLPGTSALAANGCTAQDFVDWRGRASVTIANDDPNNPYRYRPRCTMISAGTVVRFEAVPNFGMHPLYGGTVASGVAVIDPASPIGSITNGTFAERSLTEAGEFPFFCDFHYMLGMQGSILVVPELIFADGFEPSP